MRKYASLFSIQLSVSKRNGSSSKATIQCSGEEFSIAGITQKKRCQNFKSALLDNFQARFPGKRRPGKNQLQRIWQKQILLGSVNNCNSKTSQLVGLTVAVLNLREVLARVKRTMNRDSRKEIEDGNASPVSSARIVIR